MFDFPTIIWGYYQLLLLMAVAFLRKTNTCRDAAMDLPGHRIGNF